MRKLDTHENVCVAAEIERLRKSWLPDVAVDLAKRTTGAWDESIDSYLRSQKAIEKHDEND